MLRRHPMPFPPRPPRNAPARPPTLVHALRMPRSSSLVCIISKHRRRRAGRRVAAAAAAEGTRPIITLRGARRSIHTTSNRTRLNRTPRFTIAFPSHRRGSTPLHSSSITSLQSSSSTNPTSQNTVSNSPLIRPARPRTRRRCSTNAVPSHRRRPTLCRLQVPLLSPSPPGLAARGP